MTSHNRIMGRSGMGGIDGQDADSNPTTMRHTLDLQQLRYVARADKTKSFMVSTPIFDRVACPLLVGL